MEDGDPARRSKHALRRRCGKEGSVNGTDCRVLDASRSAARRVLDTPARLARGLLLSEPETL